MRRWLHALDAWLLALWWGAMLGVGGLAVPLLFRHLPSPALAGQTAAHLFSAINLLGVLCALAWGLVYGLKHWGSNRAVSPVHHAQAALYFAAFGGLAALLQEGVIAPHIVAREDLRLWHSLGSGLYALQFLGLTVLLGRRLCPARGKAPDEMP